MLFLLCICKCLPVSEYFSLWYSYLSFSLFSTVRTLCKSRESSTLRYDVGQTVLLHRGWKGMKYYILHYKPLCASDRGIGSRLCQSVLAQELVTQEGRHRYYHLFSDTGSSDSTSRPNSLSPNLSSLIISCRVLYKLYNFSLHQFLHLYNDNNSAYFRECLEELNIDEIWLKQCLAHRTCSQMLGLITGIVANSNKIAITVNCSLLQFLFLFCSFVASDFASRNCDQCIFLWQG